MSRARVLLVEDEASLAMGIADRLALEGYDATVAADGVSALRIAREQSFDLILLDVMLPEIDGFEIVRRLRKSDDRVLVLMLTARGHLADRVSGLRLGADDYLTKPFEMPELLARVEALLRRASPPADAATRVAFGDVVLDRATSQVRRGGALVPLTPVELRLLEYFVDHRDALVTREEMLARVWGYERDVYSRTIDTHVAALRQKLEVLPSKPRHFLTVHGLGYRFVA